MNVDESSLTYSNEHKAIVVDKRTGRSTEVGDWETRDRAVFKAMLAARARGRQFLPAVVRDVSLDDNQAWARLSLESHSDPNRPKKLPPAFVWLGS